MKTTRRNFLRTAIVPQAVPLIIPSGVWRYSGSKRIAMGFIGMGKQSYWLLQKFMPFTQVLAVCDADTTRRNNAQQVVKKFLSIICLLFIIAVSCFAQDKKINVLVFSKTMGYRHNSISSGLKMLSDLSQERNWILTSTENADLFTPEFLKTFDVVVFLNPTQDVLNEQQQKNFEAFMSTGKGFVGIHAAADCEYDWPWYGQLNGAFFRTHPPAQLGTVIFENTDHPTMAPFKGMTTYRTFDEWYSFKENPRAKVHVLARLDETSLDEKTLKDDKWKMGDHPLIWYQENGSIRSYYTVFGHTPEAFQDPKIKEHIGCAVDWVAKRTQ